MPSIHSQSSQQPKLSSRFLHTEPAKPIYSGHHATVNCDCCNRSMVPRVVSYYGQPLKSICPFCGTTFKNFPSGLQQFWQRFHTRTLSFTVFYRLAIVAIGFGLIGFFSSKEILPHSLGLFAIFGTIIFAPLAFAELIFQCVEQLAAKLSHESSCYWAALVLIAVLTSYAHPEFTFHLVLFLFVMLFRGLIAGLTQANIKETG